MTTRVMIVEDQGLFRDMLRACLGNQPGLAVVGAASDGCSAIQLASTVRPDVVLMDIELGPGPTGIQAGLEIQKLNPQVGMVLLTAHRSMHYLSDMLPAEAYGWSYLMKQSVRDIATLTRAVEGAAAGFTVLDPALVRDANLRQGSRLGGLTPRQQQVIALLAQGYSNASIAQQLSLGTKSVENYINALYQEFQISRDEPVHPRVTAALIYWREFVPI